jgi:hypothetical protein
VAPVGVLAGGQPVVVVDRHSGVSRTKLVFPNAVRVP